MKKLIFLLAGIVLLSGCAEFERVDALLTEKKAATTDVQKFNYLMQVSKGQTYIYEHSSTEPETFESIRDRYFKEAGLTEEPKIVKKDLVYKCFNKKTYPYEDFECVYKFYSKEIDIEKSVNEANDSAARLHQIRMEDAHNIAKTVTEEGGAEFTEVNIGRFCRASSRVVATAYASVVNTYHIYDLEADKIMLLGLTDKAFVRLKKKVTSDKRGIAMVRNNPQDQEIVYEAYDMLCHANPKSYILNYKKIFR
ncbi:hypothetical protein; putative exported protein [Xenorhabdus bovienii str. Jollieti]|uniref:Lipoprotein n=1 Tax=Xenorhabdus bovienii (strain SS-2004) TaxID=406818 RepID=D3V865_XENBS|nr:hypothetical protein [Xenorhabdus bovienii]CBJ82027.1 hypothetical protein; putative exported protein [Xenorhabdus bovienii SS-2004]CDH27853.1 hypothetical protein; putative exported protein [Xenorhabdus bovienii str. Jollieti]